MQRVRKIFNNVLTSRKCDTYLRIQEGEAIASIQNLRQNSSSYVQEIHRYSLSVARSVAFGRRVPSIHDPYAIKTKKLMETFASAMTPGKYLFESMPILRKLPRALQPWLPELELARDFENEAALTNYREALAYSEKHPNLPSVARDIYHELGKTGDISELQAATTCMEVLGAGSDTTANSILFTIMAMVTHPDVLRQAHEELDRVIGQNRMPVWADEPNLPYVRAIIKEQQRWRCIAPMSESPFACYRPCTDLISFSRLSSLVRQRRCLRGISDPEKCGCSREFMVRSELWFLLSNTNCCRAIHMDAKRYPNPEVFQPERFIKHDLSASAYANSSNANSRDHFAYGGGKRICVGIHLAERSLFSMTARLLHAFAIKPTLDGKGKEIPIDVDDLVTGLITSPKDFPVRFEVRSDAISKVLDREASDCLEGLGESWATTLDG